VNVTRELLLQEVFPLLPFHRLTTRITIWVAVVRTSRCSCHGNRAVCPLPQLAERTCSSYPTHHHYHHHHHQRRRNNNERNANTQFCYTEGLYLHRTTTTQKDENKRACRKRYSNPRSQSPSNQDLDLRPRGHWDLMHSLNNAISVGTSGKGSEPPFCIFRLKTTSSRL
jgi:hypothetical protein